MLTLGVQKKLVPVPMVRKIDENGLSENIQKWLKVLVHIPDYFVPPLKTTHLQFIGIEFSRNTQSWQC